MILPLGMPPDPPGGRSGTLTKARPSLPSIRGQRFALACLFTDSGLMPRNAAASAYVIQSLSMRGTIRGEETPRQSPGRWIFPSHTALIHAPARPTAKSQGLAGGWVSAGHRWNAKCS